PPRMRPFWAVSAREKNGRTDVDLTLNRLMARKRGYRNHFHWAPARTVPSGAFLVDLAGNKLDGDDDTVPGGDYVRTFMVDYDYPVADHIVPAGPVAAGPASLDVVFIENGDMDAPSVELVANYTLIHSGGDDSFGSGDVDVSALISSISYDGPSKTATITLTGALSVERYRLTLNAAGIADDSGNPLNAGVDQSFELLVDGISPIGALVSPAPGALVAVDQGYVNVSWDDADGVGIDPTSISIADVTVTGCQMMALRAAANAGMEVPAKTIKAGAEYLRGLACAGGGFGYTGPSGPNTVRSAIGVLVLSLTGYYRHPEVKAGADFLKVRGFESSRRYYALYYTSQAMFQAGGGYWSN
ncbi:hypothetical protein LCGC14_3036980, partial [marine sediment metagenome]